MAESNIKAVISGSGIDKMVRVLEEMATVKQVLRRRALGLPVPPPFYQKVIPGIDEPNR